MRFISILFYSNSNKSPGLHFSALHKASKVENRIALALPHLSLDKFASVISTSFDSSVNDIFRCTKSKSKLTLSFI
jgi:hypothetical protein